MNVAEPWRDRKTVTRRIVERTLRGEPLGFEAYTWTTQRITGLILLVFLTVHLYTLSSIFAGATAYDQAMRSLDRPLIKTGEFFLIWVVLFHSLNGLRLIFYNLFPELNHKRLAYSVCLGSVLLLLLSIPIVF